MLTALSENLMQPDMFELFVREAQIAETNRIVGERGAARGGIEAERTARAKIGRIKHSIMEGVDRTLFVAELKELAARADALETELSAEAAGVPEEPLLHPGLAAIYRAKVADLTAAFEDEDVSIRRVTPCDWVEGAVLRVLVRVLIGAVHGSGGGIFGCRTAAALGRERD